MLFSLGRMGHVSINEKFSVNFDITCEGQKGSLSGILLLQQWYAKNYIV